MRRMLPGTSGSACRAVARQSIERTSSPRTYSRIESNSVPWPRMSSGVRPSSSRSRVSRDGRCAREWNGGSTRRRPGRGERRLAGPEPERPRRADRDLLGAAVAATPRRELQRHPPPFARRDRAGGCGWAPRRPPRAPSRRGRPPGARAARGAARRAPTSRSRRAAPGRAARASAPPGAAMPRARGRARRRRSRGRASPTSASHAASAPCDARRDDGDDAERDQEREPTGDRHVRAAPAPAGRSTAAPRRPTRPRARPRGAAAPDAATRAGAWPARGRA